MRKRVIRNAKKQKVKCIKQFLEFIFQKSVFYAIFFLIFDHVASNQNQTIGYKTKDVKKKIEDKKMKNSRKFTIMVIETFGS